MERGNMLEAKSATATLGSLFTAAKSPTASRAMRWLQEQVKRARREGAFTITAELTPELAELLLQNNPSNRPVSAKLRDYVRDIKAGEWHHNGETVIIADTGELNDGQHRCLAVIEAGKAIVTEMVFGVARDTRRTVDTGLKRTVGQHLAMSGRKDSNNMAHAATVAMIYERHGAIARNPEWRPTSVEVLEWCDRHPDFYEHLRWGWRVAHRLRASVGLFAALHYLCSQRSAIDADAFFSDLIEGEGLNKGMPVYALRDFLIDNKGSRRRASEAEVAAITIKAWNAFRRNRRVQALRLQANEHFPEVA